MNKLISTFYLLFFLSCSSDSSKSHNSEPQMSRSADRPEDYKKLGIDPKNIAIWEDGMRTDGNKGSYEWWYFDTHLSDGSSVVIIFYTKSLMSPNNPLTPFASLEITRPGTEPIHRDLHVTPSEFKSSKEKCDVNIGSNYFRGDLQNYQIHVSDGDITIDVSLKAQVPSWRPKSGFMYFGEHDEHFFAWLPSVPQGEVALNLKIGNKVESLSGIGYHDHNWGDVAMFKLINHWYWGRAKAGDYSIITSYITAEKSYGNTELPVFMLAKGGKIIADDASKVSFTLVDEHIDKKSGKPVANTVIYEYKDGNERYKISYHRTQTIVNAALLDHVKGFKYFLAKLAGFNGSYLRFTGNVQLEHFIDGVKVEDVSHPGIWELMYFGKVR